MVSSTIDSGSVYSTKSVFPLIGCQALNPTRKDLATSILFVPLFQQFSYCASLVLMVACKNHRWVRPWMTFLHQQAAEHLLVLWKPASKRRNFPIGSTWFLHVLWPKHMVSSAKWSHMVVMVTTKSREPFSWCLMASGRSISNCVP